MLLLLCIYLLLCQNILQLQCRVHSSENPSKQAEQCTLPRYIRLRWWAQSFLAGIPRILCGFTDSKYIVRSIKEFQVDELPLHDTVRCTLSNFHAFFTEVLVQMKLPELFSANAARQLFLYLPTTFVYSIKQKNGERQQQVAPSLTQNCYGGAVLTTFTIMGLEIFNPTANHAQSSSRSYSVAMFGLAWLSGGQSRPTIVDKTPGYVDPSFQFDKQGWITQVGQGIGCLAPHARNILKRATVQSITVSRTKRSQHGTSGRPVYM